MRFGTWWIRAHLKRFRLCGGVEITKSFEGDSVLMLQIMSAPKEGVDDEKKYDSFGVMILMSCQSTDT